MRRLILKMSMSLDGFVAGPQGEIDWMFPDRDAGSTAWVLETLRAAGLHAMGSRTFRDMAAWWPTASDPMAAPMNEIPKVVFTRRGLAAGAGDTTTALRDAGRQRAAEGEAAGAASPATRSWAEAEVVMGDLADGIARLKSQPGRDILAHGGAGFARSLVAAGLVDEYRLVMHPVVLGRGLPLFTELAQPRRLERVATTAFPGGIVAHVLRPAA